jgi:hypothetical protein
VQIPIEGEPLARPLGIIHRRDRKLSETAQQFIDLLQSQATPTLAVSTNGVMTHDTNGHSTIVPEVRHIDTKDTPKRTSETGLTGSTGYEVVASTSR